MDFCYATQPVNTLDRKSVYALGGLETLEADKSPHL